MTIAVCYLSPEGVVLGADSTATHVGPHFYNFTQKVFEIGERSTLGILTWGLGGLGATSYRTLIAKLADSFVGAPPASIADATSQWVDLVWPEYLGFKDVQRFLELEKRPAFGSQVQPMQAGAPAPPAPRTQDEENEFSELNLSVGVGFCIGGYTPPDRTPAANWVWLTPALKDQTGDPAKPSLNAFPPLTYRWFGVPNVINRILNGADANLCNAIMSSPHWTGTRADLDTLISGQAFSHNILPIRDAVDFVHACIYSTVKAMKFSAFSQVCGGPPEIAVITTDRQFRWVRHKTWDAAIAEGVS